MTMKKQIKLSIRRIRTFVDKRRVSQDVREMISTVQRENLTYLSESKLLRLAILCSSFEKHQTPGILIEAGCALGGSSLVMASAKQPTRPMFIYDVFDMIPPPSDLDGEDVKNRYEVIRSGQSAGIGGDVYYGYQQDLYDKVLENFNIFGYPTGDNNIHPVKGLVQDTLHVKGPVCLAHIDVDWYEPVLTCLERIFPRLVQGGAIVLDDYFAWSGCRKAVDEYFSDNKGSFKMDGSSGSLVITRQ
jgi:asparagine synthase (glutamine-hydrolysing)